MISYPYLVKIVSAPDPGFIILVSEDMIPKAGEYLCKSIPDGLDALAGLPAYFD